jgi:hypothetical protein
VDGTELQAWIAARATQHAAEVSVRHGLAALMYRSTDNHFQFCECHGFGPRVQHALLETSPIAAPTGAGPSRC